jgi:mRNA-degrading endonuclease RelE of RelBE toxin-antitoxin system
MSVHQNEIVYEKGFRRDVYDLPGGVQDKLAFLVEILSDNAFDARLHTKPLGPPLQGLFSFRITRGYRVGFEFSEPRTIRLLIADTRKNIDAAKRAKKLSKLSAQG